MPVLAMRHRDFEAHQTSGWPEEEGFTEMTAPKFTEIGPSRS